ncbi:hypothetical protein CH379_019625 [Leptospira ellisii]|uniref:XRE family transcriptional regulator n=1 Tax=Leptospira ellisii TaxID=2023197 RepID=A0A2N0BLM5_9LEPT|nr:hypothetical protein [Leptospira ellisii]MDV6237842.1 hypothetical protein [Leptospira ellisii]PJZ92596.1 hypothetical protein CH379_12400 [Leptospira ellisii]PKA04764.1 hypothetical protein CH375_08990 [Leptospira ellisii]
MIITNGEECKDFIRQTLQMRTLRKFAEEADINYDYLTKSLNGQHSYTEVRDAFLKYNVPFQMNSRRGIQNRSNKKSRNVA